MAEIKEISRAELKKKIDNSKAQNITVWHEKRWKYPSTGDDPKSCPMLDMMLQMEQKGSTVIVIQDER
jgi:hypothetical protein